MESLSRVALCLCLGAGSLHAQGELTRLSNAQVPLFSPSLATKPDGTIVAFSSLPTWQTRATGLFGPDATGWGGFVTLGDFPFSSGASVVYDTRRNRAMFFGGVDYGLVQTRVLNDTWVLEGETWTRVDTDPTETPSPRTFHGMVYDEARDRVVLFGGGDLNLNPRGDTWEFDGSRWSLVDPGGPDTPSPRIAMRMAYDSDREVTVLYGGFLGETDTWEWDGASWTKRLEVGPATFPVGPSSLVYDRARGVMVMVEAQDGNLWEWNGSIWRRREDVQLPPREFFPHRIAYDPVRESVVFVVSTLLRPEIAGVYSLRVTGSPGSVIPFGDACGAGSRLPRLSLDQSPRIGQSLRFTLDASSEADVGSLGALFLGPALPDALALVQPSGLSCPFYLLPNQARIGLSGTGIFDFDVDVPADPSLVGTSSVAQGMVFSSEISTSRALALTFGEADPAPPSR